MTIPGAALPIRPIHPREASHLISEATEIMSSLYPAESNHFASVEELSAPDALFLGAFDGDTAVACGGFIEATPGGAAEIKRLYVRPHYRRHGVGTNIMFALEDAAKERGVRVLRLETGAMEHHARKFYASIGYTRRRAFGHYKTDPLSFFMQKKIR
jgi:putative acetyltransferase